MARGAGLPRGAVFSLCLPTTDGFFLGSHRCCQQILARLFKLQRCQIVALENHSGGSKERIKLRIQEHGDEPHWERPQPPRTDGSVSSVSTKHWDFGSQAT